ncbi:hypothetical protein HYU18_01130 [Candidatus Woesearchaeota archaeon]|nr:hypothetical protein [Candidatus Woesearchaeota archaeon]
MGLFDFGKKKEAPQQGPRAPIEDVVRLRRQGLSNNQIVQALQRNGYQTHQIFEAFSQADLRVPSAIQGGPGQQHPGPEGELEDLPPPPFGGVPEDETITGPQSPSEMTSDLPPGQNIFPEEPRTQGFGPQPGYGEARENEASAKIEEISEAIIEEKWQDLMKDYGKLTEWKGAVEQRMAAVEQRLADLKSSFDTLQKSVVDKVSDYDKSVKDVGSEMKALEQVFQKIIPTLTENVNELSRITKGMKPSDKKK